MITLEETLDETAVISATGDQKIKISDVCYDSRTVTEGSLFVAVRGVETDGHRFIVDAVEKGCAAVVAEDLPESGTLCPWVCVHNSRLALASISATFFGNPSRGFPVVGITGTNGKTTTAFLTHHLLLGAWRRCGLIGTLGYHTGEEMSPASRTTPESRDLQGLFAEMHDNGCRGAVMEVSSHALVQQRVSSVAFDVGIFTNLSQDHLDYHKSMDAYYGAKKLLFEQLVGAAEECRGIAVINIDDAYGRRLYKAYADRLRCMTYGMGVQADFRAVDPRSDHRGTTFQLEARGRSFLVRTPLLGTFNIYNALAALAAGNALGINLRESIGNLTDVPQVPGRLENVSSQRPFQVFIDYAHTPDALEKALNTLRELEPKRIITVFGCGGDRDREKRPLMGATVESSSDYAIVTSDNPRGEDPAAITRDIERGMKAGRHAVVHDRAEAISTAISAAEPGDIVLIAGKGHEDYQEVAGDRMPFQDSRVARRCIHEWTEAREEKQKSPGPREF